MSQAISIITDSGVRLDVSPTATIEVNMGGISLLSLENRTATYTNTFTLARTPINESVFEFASQAARNNRPSINVTVSKGLFQRKAVLKVVEFEKEYKCSLSYTDLQQLLKSTTLDFIEQEQTVAEAETVDPLFVKMCDPTNTDLKFKVLKTNTTYINGLNTEYCNLFIPLSRFIIELKTYLGIEISGTLLSNVDFLKCYLLVPEFAYQINITAEPLYELSLIKKANSQVLCSDVISSIALLFMSNVEYLDNEIKLNLVDTSQSINIDGFNGINKKFTSGYLAENYVKYTNEGADEMFGADTVIGEGAGAKDLIKLKCVIPTTDAVGYVTTDYEKLKNKIIILAKGQTLQDVAMTLDSYSSIVDISKAEALTLSGFYSNILNPIFANPVILDANKWFDPLTANQIMSNRVINSIQLGGRYWVDAMPYNLTTGQSKLTLIKLP